LITVCGFIAVLSLGIALQAARYAHSEWTRGPLQGEIDKAQTVAVAQRWERLPLGQIFPLHIPYSTAQDTNETAARLGVGAGDSCAAALDGTLQKAAGGFGCVAALRASYADELGGTVYTVGVIVFPNDQAALGFYSSVPQGTGPAAGLHALPLPGTPAARFTDSARQTFESWIAGPYVVISVAGYADGRPTSASAEPRDSIFEPENEIVRAVAAVLTAPQPVHCGDGEFAC
jgi:hypothetical protein